MYVPLFLRKELTVLPLWALITWDGLLSSGIRSRALIKGIPPENILIGVTHTHSAPDAYGFPDENGHVGADLEYLDWCVKQIADAVNEAMRKSGTGCTENCCGGGQGKDRL